MKLFNKLRNAFKQAPRKTLVTVLAVAALIGVPAAVVLAEYYPARQPFDYNKPCNPNDNDKYDRCGSLTGPVFNSFINTPSYGDERAFVDARRTDQTTGDVYKDVLNDVTGGSKEVVIRMYVHNNANQSTNASGLGVARNTRVRVALPTGTSQTLRARGYISADNATPRLVEDTVDLVGREQFSLNYVAGSARLYDNDNFKNGVRVSDSIVGSSGALIGSDALDGKMKGCFEYEAVVEIKVKVTPKPQQNPNIKLVKEVRKKGEKDWKKEVKAKPGEEVEWLLTTDNTGQTTLNNIVIRDVLPPHVELKSGSVKWIDAQQNAAQNDKPLFDGGINVGNYGRGSGFYMMFATKVLGDFDPCEVRIRNVGYVRSAQTPEIQDDADVVITRDNCEPPKEPVYSCDRLEKAFVSKNTYSFKTNTTARNGASVKQYRYSFGDGSAELLTDKDTVEHTFPGPGTYVTRVTVDFNVGNTVQSHTSNACKQVIEIPKEKEKCPIPGKEHLPKDSPECKEDEKKCPIPGKEHLPVDSDECDTPEVKGETTPTVLPSTGPAEVLGMFAATTVAGAIAYNLVYRRFYN